MPSVVLVSTDCCRCHITCLLIRQRVLFVGVIIFVGSGSLAATCFGVKPIRERRSGIVEFLIFLTFILLAHALPVFVVLRVIEAFTGQVICEAKTHAARTEIVLNVAILVLRSVAAAEAAGV